VGLFDWLWKKQRSKTSAPPTGKIDNGPTQPEPGNIRLTRDCEVAKIPDGYVVDMSKGTEVIITQSLGGTYTLLVPSLGGLFRLSGKDADAIGQKFETTPESTHKVENEGFLSPDTLEKEVWAQLKTCFDPEIPVNIVDLGLIYNMQISTLADGGNRVDVSMTLTAQGCGMGSSIGRDAEAKLLMLPGVKEAQVQIVWDPPWGPQRISAEGRALMGME
jgi:probable FeS assembly SUF system protein SufT